MILWGCIYILRYQAMATPASSNWDDLIIISDDIVDTSTVTAPISAGSTPTQEVTSSSVTFEPAPASNDIFAWLDLSNFETPQAEAPISSPVKEENQKQSEPVQVLEESTSQVLEEASTQNETSEAEEQVEIDTSIEEGDMDEILSETMSRLRKRQETSRSSKASKLSQIDSLNQKIAKLKEQVVRLKDEVAALESEDAKIEANVVALENMKSIPSEITEVDMESHKQKRVIRSKKA